MNIFVLDLDLQKCAEYHVDKHVIKMIVEHTQLLSTANRLSGLNEGYKTTHKNHPCAIWTRESLDNWIWLRDLTEKLNEEYKFRYNKTEDHKSYVVAKGLSLPNIQSKGLTPFALAMPDECRTNDAVESYRTYYMTSKRNLASWKNRQTPSWYI